MVLSLTLTGNGLGDPCDGDFDDDKVPDAEDACPVNHHCTRTDFNRMIAVELNPFESPSTPAAWVVDSTVSKNRVTKSTLVEIYWLTKKIKKKKKEKKEKRPVFQL